MDARDDLTAIRLIPAPVKLLGNAPELDDEVAEEVPGLDLAAFFLLAPPTSRTT